VWLLIGSASERIHDSDAPTLVHRLTALGEARQSASWPAVSLTLVEFDKRRPPEGSAR
jgi:hypothetical protein